MGRRMPSADVARDLADMKADIKSVHNELQRGNAVLEELSRTVSGMADKQVDAASEYINFFYVSCYNFFNSNCYITVLPKSKFQHQSHTPQIFTCFIFF